jgi:hypothetical protein
VFPLNLPLAFALLKLGYYFSRLIPNSMKRRHRYMLNIFSASLLLVALYLNFVKKETNDIAPPVINGSTANKIQTGDEEPGTVSQKQSAQTIVLK